ncbi:SCO4225 family membrane protein [Streptomyces sp. NPDC057496]|uniref:SCO4225 family membrane protein n=1 Tax=Streptomyces sp. NPDC057496 TaxID=3346149 RepID=UPI0036989997
MNIRALYRLTFANPASAVYLGIVGASVVFEIAAALLSDPGIVGVWPFLLTAPTSLVTVTVGQALWNDAAPGWFLVAGVVFSALIQSFALGAVLETLRARRRVVTRPSRG